MLYNIFLQTVLLPHEIISLLYVRNHIINLAFVSGVIGGK